jgi:hypothetical protein
LHIAQSAIFARALIMQPAERLAGVFDADMTDPRQSMTYHFILSRFPRGVVDEDQQE